MVDLIIPEKKQQNSIRHRDDRPTNWWTAIAADEREREKKQQPHKKEKQNGVTAVRSHLLQTFHQSHFDAARFLAAFLQFGLQIAHPQLADFLASRHIAGHPAAQLDDWNSRVCVCVVCRRRRRRRVHSIIYACRCAAPLQFRVSQFEM